MQTDEHAALRKRYPWLFDRFHFLEERPLVVQDRIQKSEVIYPAPRGDVLRLEIHQIRAATIKALFDEIDKIHLETAQGKEFRRCRLLNINGQDVTLAGFNQRECRLYRPCEFNIGSVAYVLSNWREPDTNGGASLLVLIEVNR